ncbi:MAG: hypothetical protein ABSG91_05610 [Syntrophobacteraceae bacterium]|jgi:NADPH-dependent glutamate synthase beta subunit-like oxidoreductase
MALDEGVEVRDRLTPVRIEAEDGKYLLTLCEARATEPGCGPAAEDANGSVSAGPAEGKTETIRISRIFKAGGLEAAAQWMLPPEDGEGVLRLNNSVPVLTQGGPRVFGGDLVNASKSVVHAVASGKEAAMALDLLFREGPGETDAQFSEYAEKTS